jgi:hypothetical protein
LEDVLVPRLRLSSPDHSAYCYLLRHSRLEGKRQLWFSIPWLARVASRTSLLKQTSENAPTVQLPMGPPWDQWRRGGRSSS